VVISLRNSWVLSGQRLAGRLGVAKKVAPDVLFDLIPHAVAALKGEAVGPVFMSLTQMFVADTISWLGLTSPELLDKLTELLD
jgi:hypothetical protein